MPIDSKRLAERIVDTVSPFKVSISLLVLSYVAADIVVPFVVAVLLAFLLLPLVRFFDRRRVPHSLSCVLALLFAGCLIVGIFGYAYLELSGASAQIGRWFSRLQKLHTYLLSLFNLPQLPDGTTEPIFYLKPEFWTQLTIQALSHISVFMAHVVLIIFFVFFLLLEGGNLIERILLVSGKRREQALEIMAKIDVRIHQYISTVFLIEAALSIAIAIMLSAFGVPYAFLWGLLSGILGLIPFIGATIAAIPPVLVTLAEFPGYHRAAIVLGMYIFFQLMDGKFITPMLVGRRVHLSPLIIILSVVFWGWMWGLTGLLLATPLMVCIKVFAENIPSLKSLSILMEGAGSQSDPRLPAAEKTESPSEKLSPAEMLAMSRTGKLASTSESRRIPVSQPPPIA